MKTYLVFLQLVADGSEFVAPVLAANRTDALLAAAAKYRMNAGPQEYKVQTCYALDEMQRIMVQAGRWTGDDSMPVAEAPAPALDSRLVSALAAIRALTLPTETLEAHVEIIAEAPVEVPAEAAPAPVEAAEVAPKAPVRIVAASISPRADH